MQILWVVPYIPVPLFGGGTRVFNLIKTLSGTCDIDLLAIGDVRQQGTKTLGWIEGMKALKDLRSFCRTVDIVDRGALAQKSRRFVQVKSLTSRHPAQFWASYSSSMQQRIDAALQERKYHVVLLEHSFTGYYVIPEGPLRVLDQHNVEAEILLRSARRERSSMRRAFNLLEYWRYRSDERAICRHMDLILAASARDRDTMQGWSDTPDCCVVPNGVDSDYFALSGNTPVREQPGSIVFTGSMHYAPNAEAMLSFTATTWPLIRQQVPDATLTIVGPKPPPEILKLGSLPNVTVAGFVPDLRPYLSAAQVVVAPLHIGGGTRLKILEAMAMERAIVSTSVGCEGLEVEPGRHLVVADDPHEFAAAVAHLLSAPQRREAIGREGRSLVEDLYDWRAVGRQMEGAIKASLARQETLYTHRLDPSQAHRAS